MKDTNKNNKNINNKQNYNPFKTAIMRYDLSKPTKILLNKALLIEPILNYGCGNNEDSQILKALYGINMIGYDKYNPIFNDESLLNGNYNTITCFYMFNVIDSLKTHKELVDKLMKYDSNIYICVRSDIKAIKDNWIYDEECLGYWTTNNTFQRFYTEEMCRELFHKDIESIVNNSQMKLLKLK